MITLVDNRRDYDDDEQIDSSRAYHMLEDIAGKEKGYAGDMDIVTGFFTVGGLKWLGEKFDETNTYRLILAKIAGEKENPNSTAIDLLSGEDFCIRKMLELKGAAKAAAEFLNRENVEVRIITDHFCHAKSYIFKNTADKHHNCYLTGSSNLTEKGLGMVEGSSNIELNVAAIGYDSMWKNHHQWFEELWTSENCKAEVHKDPDDSNSEMIPVKQYFINLINQSLLKKFTPEDIYYKILFELFGSDMALGLPEDTQQMHDLQSSVIWKTLFKYQQSGVISLIKMLRKYNGAILADAVGLGKTFSALAVIKYFQEQKYTTILLCPKKLEQNWTMYRKGAGSRFDKDEFEYQVRFHTDLQNDRLQNSYDDYKLDYLQKRQKLLIVIDESHNLRNDKSGRYVELLEKLIKNQNPDMKRDVKILMLSATPINTGLNDVKNQFNLIGKGRDDAFNTVDFGVESLKNLFMDAQKKYKQWCEEENRTIGQIIGKLPPAFFNLTDKLIVARTRKLIEKTLGEDLGFPKKEKPENIYQGVDHFGELANTEAIYKAFDELSLTAYQPSLFLHASRDEAKKEAKEDWQDNVNRERFLVKMMGVLFMKRLESSWFSCKTTIEKVLQVHENTLDMVKAFMDGKKKGTITIEVPDSDDENVDLPAEFDLRGGRINLAEMKNLGGFKLGLEKDIKRLKAIQNSLQSFEDSYKMGLEKDLKLEKLVEIIKKKQADPENKKVVIFTAFADTASFLFNELTTRFGIGKIASVSGSEVHCTGMQSTNGYTSVLQRFAPYSKLYKEKDWTDLYEFCPKLTPRDKYYNEEKDRWEVPFDLWKKCIAAKDPSTQKLLDDPIDILIATDCLSEGQNLQDADLQVNYDIHWNPVRIIQRFGRIDRIGSPNKSVKCINFWPAKSFEDYLHLETRIMNRQVIMNLTGSETMELNEAYKKMEADNTLIDKNADALLKQLTENSISEIENPRTVSLQDFSFELYRQDLLDYLNRNKDFFKSMPNGAFSGFKVEPTLFDNVPESLVAVVGYPHKEVKPKDFHYTEIYLMCQPVDPNLPADYVELNRADILRFLRENKNKERFVPTWITDQDEERIKRLSEILREWMIYKAPKQVIADRKNRFKAKGNANKKGANDQSQDQKFQLENFDLIAWDYVSR